MNAYRDFDCNSLNIKNLNDTVKISGWIDTIRDHGNLLFIDLRDNYGITQCVVESNSELFKEVSKLRNELHLNQKASVV